MHQTITILLLSAAPLFAQWLSYPMPGTPRLPNGKPNLATPAPRAADGHPDLSGLWQLEPAPCAANAIQQIFTDGRPLPKDNEKDSVQSGNRGLALWSRG